MRISPYSSSMQSYQMNRFDPPARPLQRQPQAARAAQATAAPPPEATRAPSPAQAQAPDQPAGGVSLGEMIAQAGKLLMQQIMDQVQEEVGKLEKNLKEHLQKVKELAKEG